jgi:hypothetical protein
MALTVSNRCVEDAQAETGKEAPMDEGISVRLVYLACVAAIRERTACTKPHALPYLPLVLSEDEKSDWFKMKKIY